MLWVQMISGVCTVPLAIYEDTSFQTKQGKDPKLKELPDCNITVKTFTWVNYFSL